MKKIIIATDFSIASRNASVYGIALAKAIDAKIILFNAYKIPNPPPGLNLSISRYDIMMQAKKQLSDESRLFDSGNLF